VELRKLDLRRLEIFCNVLEKRSFSKAAESLYLTQPTLSQHIKSLEDSLGLKLFDRLGREVVPTKAGILLYDYAKKIMDIKKQAEESIEYFTGAIKGSLIIGGSTIPGEYIIPPLLGRFRELYPQIGIRIKIKDTKDIIDDVINGSIELGVVGAKIEKNRLNYIKFIKDELILVVYPTHPWNEKRIVSLNELKDEPIIIREEGSGTRIAIKNTLKKYGLNIENLNIVAEIGSTGGIKEGIKSKIGVSILSKMSVKEELEYGILHTIEIENIKIYRDFYIVYNNMRAKSPICELFLNFLLAESPRILS
jgi:DNA-binding transcriptional LysR family regulator